MGLCAAACVLYLCVRLCVCVCGSACQSTCARLLSDTLLPTLNIGAPVRAANIQVGGAAGWVLQPGNKPYAPIQAKCGDNLIFAWTGVHAVQEVTAGAMRHALRPPPLQHSTISIITRSSSSPPLPAAPGPSASMAYAIRYPLSSNDPPLTPQPPSPHRTPASCTAPPAVPAVTLGPSNGGSLTVPLPKAGTRYFSCQFSNHCANGQLVTVVTTCGSAAASPPPAKQSSSPPPKKASSPPPKKGKKLG